MSVKPILFNTEMVQAILDGRKTVTRRVIKLKYSNTHIEWKNDKYGKRLIELQNDVEGETHGRNPDGSTWHKLLAYRELKAPYTKGDILYVRETWWADKERQYFYRADGIYPQIGDNVFPNARWKPSIHMSKEAARIWLKVTDVRVKRLQNISASDTSKEGVLFDRSHTADEMIDKFAKLWNSTIPKQDLDKYGWDANPWVWTIQFERCEKPEEG